MRAQIEYLETRYYLMAPAFPTNIPQVVNDPALRGFVQAFEGYRLTVYPDSASPPNPTIGIGSNINGRVGRQKITAVFGNGISYPFLIAGEDDNGDVYGLTDAQVQRLFTYDLYAAYQTAQSLFPNLSTYSEYRQISLIDFCFNTKNPGSFSKFRSDVNNEMWYDAGEELVNSDRFLQIPEDRTDAEFSYLQAGNYHGEIYTSYDPFGDGLISVPITASYDIHEYATLSGTQAVVGAYGEVEIETADGPDGTGPYDDVYELGPTSVSSSPDDSRHPGEIDLNGVDGYGDSQDLFVQIFQLPNAIPSYVQPKTATVSVLWTYINGFPYSVGIGFSTGLDVSPGYSGDTSVATTAPPIPSLLGPRSDLASYTKGSGMLQQPSYITAASYRSEVNGLVLSAAVKGRTVGLVRGRRLTPTSGSPESTDPSVRLLRATDLVIEAAAETNFTWF